MEEMLGAAYFEQIILVLMILINMFASHVDTARVGMGLVNVGQLKKLGFHGMTPCLLTP